MRTADGGRALSVNEEGGVQISTDVEKPRGAVPPETPTLGDRDKWIPRVSDGQPRLNSKLPVQRDLSRW